jgi:hypothetical protein
MDARMPSDEQPVRLLVVFGVEAHSAALLHAILPV